MEFIDESCSSFLCLTCAFDVQWSDKKLYNKTLKKLAGLFQKNFEVYADYKVGGDNNLTQKILEAGPVLQ